MGPSRDSLPNGRQWLTEGEIKSVVHGEMRDALKEQNVLLDKIADGAQAAILSATILHGDPAVGLKGAIPDLQDRMSTVERELREAKRITEEHHSANINRFEAVETSQDEIKAAQHPLRAKVRVIQVWLLTQCVGGKTRFAIIVGTGGVVLTWCVDHMHDAPTWLRRMAHWLSK